MKEGNSNKETIKIAEKEIKAIYEKYNLCGFSVSIATNPESVSIYLHQITTELFKDSIKKLNQACDKNLKIEENLLSAELPIDNKLNFVLFAIYVGYYLQKCDFIPLKVKIRFKELMINTIGTDITEQITNPTITSENECAVSSKNLSFLSILEKHFLFSMSESIKMSENLKKSLGKKKRWESPYKFN